MRRALPATGGPIDAIDAIVLLRNATELHPIGRLVDASNVTLLCEVDATGHRAIYKPIEGEQPLWDFPDGSLAAREVAAYEVSDALGFHLVPPTILREGPLGPGAVQLWIEHAGVEEAIRLVNSADRSLRPLSLFDAIVNNGDRKAGHLLPLSLSEVDREAGGDTVRVLGVDHGVTFAVDPKLRTVLWAWRSAPFTPEERELLGGAVRLLAAGGPLCERLEPLITEAEISALRDRVAALLGAGCFPEPSEEWPPLPWPLV